MSMNKVYVTKEVKAPFKYKRLFKKQLDTLVRLHGIEGDTEVNLIITDNKGIQAISKQYKKKDKPTDVLSFPADYQAMKPLIGYNMLGDIYISHEKIAEQAASYNHSIKREWSYLFAHGLLHLIGYDHLNEIDDHEMSSHAQDIMDIIKVGR